MALTLEKLRSITTTRLAALGLPIAVDFGSSALKVLQVTSPESPGLVAAAMVPTPEPLLSDPNERLEFQIEALARVLKGTGFRGRRVVCGVPSGQTACKPLKLQNASGSNVHALIRAAIPTQLGCDPGAVVYRHVEVSAAGKSAGKSEVILFATARDLVERLMRAVKAARFEPVGIHNEFAATVYSLGPPAPGEADGGATLYLDVGAGFTRAMIAHGRSLVFAKTIEVGGRHLDALAAEQLKVGLEEARSRRQAMTALVPPAAAESGQAGMALLAAGMAQGGALPDRAVAAETLGPAARGLYREDEPDLREQLEILTDEVSMCLRYHESACPEKKVDRVVFLGGESRHVALCQHVARAIRLPAQLADPLARVARSGDEPCIGVDLSGNQPGWALALGLCLGPTDL